MDRSWDLPLPLAGPLSDVFFLRAPNTGISPVSARHLLEVMFVGRRRLSIERLLLLTF